MADRGLISHIASTLEASPIRRMAPYLARPEVISLAGGVPDPATFPIEAIGQAVARALRTQPALALQYGRTRGNPDLLLALSQWLRSAGIPADHERLFVTAGSQQALDLVGRVLLDPGDTIVVETPTYAGALSAFRAVGARFEMLDSAGDSPAPEAVGRAVNRARAHGSVARALYLLPNFQNPAGTSLGAVARQGLLEAAAEHDLTVIEDDPYRELWFERPPPAPMVAGGGAARVIYLGSLSKVLAPGLRLGFVLAPEELVERLERMKEAADLCSSTLSQVVAAELLATGQIDRRMPEIRALYRGRAAAALAALDESLAERVSYTRPAGGFFVWLEVPGLDAERLLERALEQGVAFVPGRMFHAAGGGEHTLRLAFSREPEDRLREGIRRLAPLLLGHGTA